MAVLQFLFPPGAQRDSLALILEGEGLSAAVQHRDCPLTAVRTYCTVRTISVRTYNKSRTKHPTCMYSTYCTYCTLLYYSRVHNGDFCQHFPHTTSFLKGRYSGDLNDKNSPTHQQASTFLFSLSTSTRNVSENLLLHKVEKRRNKYFGEYKSNDGSFFGRQ
jgi:hypothetical protein